MNFLINLNEQYHNLVGSNQLQVLKSKLSIENLKTPKVLVFLVEYPDVMYDFLQKFSFKIV